MLNRSRSDADTVEMRRFGKVLADFQQTTGQSVLVSWLGGEPLLWPMLTELSEYFTQTLGLKLSTTTNGTALAAPRVRTLLAKCFSELTVSVDGFADFHDRVRDSPGSYASLHDNVRAFAALGGRMLLRANTVLMRGNVVEYPALCRELAGWGFHELTFNQLGGNDRPEFYPDNRLLATQVSEFFATLPALRAELSERSVELRGSHAYLHRMAATTNGERLPIQDCGPGTRYLFIDERGMAAPCSFTTAGYGVSVSEIRDVAALIALPTRFAAMRRAERLAPCLDCHSTQVFEKFHA
jgi:MoaA/NifB/PqqE/SkfB family radical SAM enzyme